MESSTVTLRDGRSVSVAPQRASDREETARLIATSGDARAVLAELASARSGVFVARAASDDKPIVACVLWRAANEPQAGGELAGYVTPDYRGAGLGTLLVRRAAEDAVAHGLRELTVELYPGGEATAEMLRDLGLSARWLIAYPDSRVTLELGRPRPGWSTPAPS